MFKVVVKTEFSVGSDFKHSTLNIKPYMNVGLIHYSYPPTLGGVEFVVQGQARAFAHHGHRVRVIAAHGRAASEKNIRCFLPPELRQDHPLHARVRRQLSRGKVTPDFDAYREKIAKKLRPLIRGLDLVLVHNIMTMPFNMAFTAALWDLAVETRAAKRWVFWTHDLCLLNPDDPRLDTRRFPFSLLKQRHPSARYVAVSDLRRRELCRLLRISHARVSVVPNGVDVPALLDLDPGVWSFFLKQKLVDQDHVFFLPARILPRKNLEAAIQLIAELKKHRKKIKLLMTGAPDPHHPSSIRYFRRIRAQVRKLGLEKDVIFLNKRFRVGFRQLLSLYRLCDAVLMTSRQEGFGLPLVEGGIHSKPVICPRRPPFTQIVGRQAIFLAEDKPVSGARAVLRALDRSATAAHFKRTLRNYRWEAIWKNHLLRLVGS